jgi:hypothetical protein
MPAKKKGDLGDGLYHIRLGKRISKSISNQTLDACSAVFGRGMATAFLDAQII